MTRLGVTVELERGSEPIEGRIGDSHGSWLNFTGWLELIVALERAHRDGPAHAGRAKDFGDIHDAPAVPGTDNRSAGAIETRGELMAYARITRFTGATAEQIGRAVSAVQAADGPPPGVLSTGVTVVANEQDGAVILIGFFATEDDLRTGDSALRQMDAPPFGPLGTLASVDMGEIRAEHRA